MPRSLPTDRSLARKVPHAESARKKTAARGYGAQWRRLRAMVLRREPLCRRCTADGRLVGADVVDHVRPLSQGGTNAMDNLQPLCKRCHDNKTSTEDGGFGRKGRTSNLCNGSPRDRLVSQTIFGQGFDG